MSIISAVSNIISAEANSKSNFSLSKDSSTSSSSNIHVPVSQSFSYSNFGNSKIPVTRDTRNKNQQSDKITPRDTTAASSYTPGQSLPQQPDPSIALLPRGEQQNSLFSKVNGL